MNKPSSEKTTDHFFYRVYEIVRLIPRGRVTTYGAIAKALGTGASRQVGMAMNASHGQLPPVPAHRVVNRQGLLTGKHHFGPANEMQALLEAEGIRVSNDRVIDFVQCFWDPAKELLPD